MIPLNITSDSGDGVTVLSNRFIDQYLKDANDAQIKVYLYLLRMLSANLPTDIAEIADKFNQTEKEILRALSYWEKLHLLSLDYDAQKNIIGIRLCMPSSQELAVPSESVPSAPVSIKVVSSRSKDVPMDYEAEKNSYAVDDLVAFKNNPESRQLLFAAQQYLKRTVSGPETKTLLFIYDRLGFGLDLTDYLLQYCIERGQKSFRMIEQTAILWYEAGIINIKQAKAFQQAQLSPVDAKICLEIMNLLGKQGLPARKEQEYIDRWIKEQAYPMELIEEACNRTVMKVEKNRFAYANSILEAWRREQIHSLKDLNASESAKKQPGSISRSTHYTGSKKAASFCNIEQHDYDFSELEAASLKKALAVK